VTFCNSCGKELPPDIKFCPNCGAAVVAWTPPPGAPPAPPPISVEAGTGKYCSHCGAVIPKEAEICPKCGVRVMEPPRPMNEKNPGIAAVLSFLFTGLGQIYNEQIGKGVTFIIIGIICALSIFVLIGIIAYPLFWIYNIYDAYRSAQRINAGLERPD
jgi:TM2 domain-containing membrane protein YozV/RNA polymerase subunit RPABC4/transcription elongation factor Spt4